jgi:hypothetical protein
LLTTGQPSFLHPVVVGGEHGVWGCGGGAGVGGGGARRGPPPALWRCVADLRLSWPPSPCRDAAHCRLRLVAGGGGWSRLVQVGGVYRTVGGGLRSGAALVDVRLDVGPLLPRSSLPTVAGCRLGGFPAGRDRWGEERVVGGVLTRINIGTDVHKHLS